MTQIEKIIRAWKDEDYLMSLPADEQQALPENPAGLLELPRADLNISYGHASTWIKVLYFCF